MKIFLAIVFFFLWLPVGALGEDTEVADVDILAEDLETFLQDSPPPLDDNLEGVNRPIHDFNLFLDKVFVRSIARPYGRYVPLGVRRGVANFLYNLSDPYSAVNNVLQGDARGAAHNLARFLINSSIGVLGLFDVASEVGYAKESEDFGQTLAVWGVGDGGYIVLPFFGPQTLRSSLGLAPTFFIATNPLMAWARDRDEDAVLYASLYVGAVSARSGNLVLLENLERTSLDFYVALRSLYWQNRLLEISK